MSGAPDVVVVVAFDANRAIGRDGALPWHLPADLRRFKALTLGKPMLMGRKTAQSIGRALPGRGNLVLTRGGWVPIPGMQPIGSVEAAIAFAQAEGSDELCVIGGGEVYALAMPKTTRMHVTRVHAVVDGTDARFPDFDPGEWRETGREHHAVDARHAYAFDFIDLVRR